MQHLKREISNFFGIFAPKVVCEKKFFRNELIVNYFINKKLNRKCISNLLSDVDQGILCSKDLECYLSNKYIPGKRLLSNFCINAFIKILKLSGDKSKNVSIALLDLTGKYANLLNELILYSNNISVISNNLEVYLRKQKEFLKSFGASVTINNNVNWLFKTKVLLAPDKIRISLPLKQSSVTFTSERSAVPLKGTVYSKYKFPTFSVLKDILPDEISQEYFLFALYDICKKKEFGNLTPYYLFNGSRYISLKTISNLIFE